MASWNCNTTEMTDPNPPHLTNLEDGSGEYSDSGRDGIQLFPDGVFAAGCLGAAIIVSIILVLIPVIMIFGD